MEDSEETARKRQKVSKVWDHFKLKKTENLVQCVYCKIELAYHNSTSSMLQHLNRKHPFVNKTSSSEASTSTSSQQRMDSFVRHVPHCTVEEAAVLTESILNMLITDMRPLSMVEDKGFRNMISMFNPKYNLPSRTHFTNLMEKKYEKIKEKLKISVKEAESVALTADIWTSVATEAYLGVTCHFLGNDWEMKSLTLTTMPLEERHTAVNIAEWLEEATTKFEIPFDKVKAVVHDNGSNIVAAATILKEKHGWASVRCAGHTLNLVVQNTLKNNKTVSSCVGAARCLVEHFKKSELACTKLKEKQQQMGAPKLMLIQDVSTRWNSTHHMLSRLHAQRWPVTAVLSDPTVNPRGKHRYLDLKPEQWTLSEELIQILEPFEAATVFLSGEKYVTVSALPQLVQNLKKSTDNSACETTAMKALKADMIQQITDRWNYLLVFSPEDPNTTLLAAALDPRFRKLKFLPAEEVFKVQSTIQTMALRFQNEARQSNAQANEDSTSLMEDGPSPHAKGKDGSFLSILGSSSESNSCDEEEDDQQSQEIQREILQYFGEHALSRKDNPLSWWKVNASRYPTLARLAKSFLSIPATSTPSERLFSAAGNIASKRRASLSAEHVDMLTFLHCNHHLLF
ncbi:E3 SUMO-protein ligase ZBED1-like [Centropristis striata]|uniref:E3 SUMO-protein ligase ZBED1-like n=1 Tax=Centropristis striata TaxID=184440 RepID=UPI0027DF5B28|nr:E3 SUMO-protein ligase ZBED1-like [Centropristis striata]